MRKDCFITRYNPHPDANELNFSRSVCASRVAVGSPLDEFVFWGWRSLGRSPLPNVEGMEKGVELNSFPPHEFFSASFHANFHFACPKAPSLPPPFTPFLPYSASVVACATGGETFSSEARESCLSRTNLRVVCAIASRTRIGTFCE